MPLDPRRLLARPSTLALGAWCAAALGEGVLLHVVTARHPAFDGVFVVDTWRTVVAAGLLGTLLGLVGEAIAWRFGERVGRAVVVGATSYLFGIGFLTAYAGWGAAGALGAALVGSGVLATALASVDRERPAAAPVVGGSLLATVVLGGVALVFLAAGRDREALVERVLEPLVEAGPEVATSAPDLLLVTVDTLRADHTGPYGYTAIATPTLDAWAAEGVVYEQMTANSSWTRSSFGSIMSARMPSDHGANWVLVDPDGVGGEPERTVFSSGLDASLPTLAGALRERGYRTVGLNTNVQTSTSFGFDRGFDVYLDLARPMSVLRYSVLCAGLELHVTGACDRLTSTNETYEYRPAPEVTGLADRMLDALVSDPQPFFLWVHYMDPHVPYRAHRPDAETLEYHHMERWLGGDDVDLEAVVAQLTRAYDDEIVFVDDWLGELAERLDTPRLRNAGLVFTSDHGEELGERWKPAAERTDGRLAAERGYGHGHTQYDEQVKVPLLIRWPDRRRAGERATHVAMHLDIAPTFLGMAGGTFPGAAGIDLADPDPAGRVAISEANYHAPVVTSARTPTAKALVGDAEHAPDLSERYDLVADPGERSPTDASTPDLAEVDAALARWMRDAKPLAPSSGGAQDAGVDEALRMLGYVE